MLARGWWVALALIGLYLGGIPIPDTGMARAYGRLFALPASSIHVWVGLHIVGAAAVVLAVLGSPLLQAGLSRRPMRWLGRTSFGLYLVHMVVIGTVASGLMVWLVPRAPYEVAALIAVLATLVVSLAGAELFTRWVDAPTLALTSRTYRLARSRVRPQAQGTARP